jgi:hypothetical protein
LRAFPRERPSLVVQLLALRGRHAIDFQIFEKMHAALARGRNIDIAIEIGDQELRCYWNIGADERT